MFINTSTKDLLLWITLSQAMATQSNTFYSTRWLPMFTKNLKIFFKTRHIPFWFVNRFLSRLFKVFAVIETEMLDNSYGKRQYLTIKNRIKFKLKCFKMYNISLITIEIFCWYNIHNRFISMGIVLLLVVNYNLIYLI